MIASSLVRQVLEVDGVWLNFVSVATALSSANQPFQRRGLCGGSVRSEGQPSRLAVLGQPTRQSLQQFGGVEHNDAARDGPVDGVVATAVQNAVSRTGVDPGSSPSWNLPHPASSSR